MEIEDPSTSRKYFHESPEGPGTLAHMEIVRHLHNFLAAAKSLVDQTRVLIEEHYTGTDVAKRFQVKITDDLSEDPLVKFVHDLRNYMVHRGLPPTSMTLNATRTSINGPAEVATSIYTDRDKLLQWDRWTAPAREFLKNQPERFRILEFSAPYGERILRFYERFDTLLAAHHAQDIDELQSLQRQLTGIRASAR
jgi:hypothetical protein